jgi:hypothetical protein
MHKHLINKEKPAVKRAFLWAKVSGGLAFCAVIDKERLAFGHPLGRSRHIHRLAFLWFDVPIAMADGAGDADISQAQDFVFLRAVVRLAVAAFA